MGTREHEPRWDARTLRLLTILTQTADTLFTHDVFVEESDDE